MFPSFSIFNEVIYTYPLIMGMAWGFGIQYIKYLDSKLKKNIKGINLLFSGVFVSSWLGAKVFFIITSSHIDKEAFLVSSNFWLGGGFVFYGGLIFGILFTLLFISFTKQSLSKLNIFIPALLISHGVGRIGCFFAGCCFGSKPHFHLGLERYPVQLMESASLFILAIISLKLIKKRKSVLSFYIISYSSVRFVLEFIRGDLIRGEYFGLSTSQLISIFLIIVMMIIHFVPKKKEA